MNHHQKIIVIVIFSVVVLAALAGGYYFWRCNGCKHGCDLLKGCKNPCDKFQCQNKGTCKVTSTKKPQCDCPSGYSGDHCEKYVCDNFQCQNKGTCKVTSKGTAQCDCASGFKGDHCEKTTVASDVLNYISKAVTALGCAKYKNDPAGLTTIIVEEAAAMNFVLPTSVGEALKDAVQVGKLVENVHKRCQSSV